MVRSTSRELRTRSAMLLHRWSNWWRDVWDSGSISVGEGFLAVCAYCSRVRDHNAATHLDNGTPGQGWARKVTFLDSSATPA
jgi:hypothetical protein